MEENFMTKLEQKFQDGIRDKFSVTKLEFEPVTRENMIHQETAEQRDFKFYQRHMAELREKFGLAANFSALECEGLLGLKLSENQRTLEQAVIDDARQKTAGYKLATAKVSFQNQPVRLWIEVRR
jgi:hypothetical protein